MYHARNGRADTLMAYVRHRLRPQAIRDEKPV
jgi:hypothetical protein